MKYFNVVNLIIFEFLWLEIKFDFLIWFLLLHRGWILQKKFEQYQRVIKNAITMTIQTKRHDSSRDIRGGSKMKWKKQLLPSKSETLGFKNIKVKKL